jgi:esterase
MIRLHYKTLGNGKPLVILHGLFGSCDNWLTFSKLLSDKFQIFLIDQRNHGLSPHTEHHNYELMAQDLYDFLNEHNIINPVLVGHSMGGKTVIKFLVDYPEFAIEKAIIVDIAPKSYPPHHQVYIQAMLAVDLTTIQSRQDVEQIFIAEGLNNVGERQFLAKNIYRDESGNFRWRINLPVLIDEIENIGEGTPDFAHVEVPILFVKGEKSTYYIQKPDAILIHQIFPFAKIVTIKDAGHWIHAEQPQALYEAIINFLDK